MWQGESEDDQDYMGAKVIPNEEESPLGLYSGIMGAATATCNVASASWKWLQVSQIFICRPSCAATAFSTHFARCKVADSSLTP